MKKILLLLVVLFSIKGIIFSQTTPKFTLTKDGVSPVLLAFDGSLTADIIYKKVKEWAAKNPNTTIRIDQANTQVKVGILKEKAWKVMDKNFENWYDLKYTLNIDIKDAKCRVIFDTPDVKYKVWFNKDGSIIKKYKDSKASFEAAINESLTKLNKHITEQKKVTKDEW